MACQDLPGSWTPSVQLFSFLFGSRLFGLLSKHIKHIRWGPINLVKWAGATKVQFVGKTSGRFEWFPRGWRNLDLAFRAFVRQSKMHQRWDWVEGSTDALLLERDRCLHLNRLIYICQCHIWHQAEQPSQYYCFLSSAFLWRSWKMRQISFCNLVSARLAQWALIASILIKISHQPFMAAHYWAPRCCKYFCCLHFLTSWEQKLQQSRVSWGFMAVLESVRNSRLTSKYWRPEWQIAISDTPRALHPL